MKDRLIRDRVVAGVYDKKLQEKLLNEANVTLDKVIDVARKFNAAMKQSNVMNTTEEENAILRIKKSSKNYRSSFVKNIENCKRCSKTHEINKCPAYQKKCIKCDKFNHFAKMCKGRNAKQSDKHKKQVKFSHIKSVGTNKEDSCSTTQWEEDLVIKGKKLKFKLDTGAEANVIPLRSLKLAGLTPLSVKKCKEKLINYSSTNIATFEFFIVDSDSPILGLESCIKLKLINRIQECNRICQKDLLKEIEQRFNHLFEGIVHAPRKVAFPLLDQLKKELCKLENMNIIKKVNTPTDWVNSTIVMKKTNNELRIYLDPQDLNKNLKREYFPLPTCDEIISKVSGAKVFSKLDAKKGFYQISLDEESAKLTTFNSPFGRYCFCKLSFGLNIAPEVFYKYFSQLLDGIEGVQVYMDDIIVSGRNDEEHKKRLLEVLYRLEKNNVKLNKNKCEWAVNKLIFGGHEFSSDGIKPDPSKVKAIKNMPAPKCKKDVEIF
ncbi:uncharacterized protein K02A2.6-like [Daktulosphaira vitifoliae]|uniref:uncharacterized protein K02A2.6-like n=1 Tax=Daktulosphaira vitifoliae TaxID=58002 RepID=UPI0021AA579C|nr:uncharacterized protein K02A2.6-like [Daktulosphaira vitifoliae]